MHPFIEAFWTSFYVKALRRALGDIGDDNLSFIAGGVTFFGFLAVFPALGALAAIWGVFSDPATIQSQLGMLRTAMPPSAYEVFETELIAITTAPTSQLTIGAILALVFSLWSATKGARAMIAAMNVAYGQVDRRPFLRKQLMAIAFTAGGILYAILSIALVAALPPVLKAIEIGAWSEAGIHIMRWLAAIALFVAALGALYRWAPNRKPPPMRWLAPGAILATVLWIVASTAFSLYAANFADYNATFGALGSVVALMMWMWLSSFVVCFGAVLNAELEPGRRGRAHAAPADTDSAAQTKGPAAAEPHVTHG